VGGELGKEGGKFVNKCFAGGCPVGRAAQSDGRSQSRSDRPGQMSTREVRAQPNGPVMSNRWVRAQPDIRAEQRYPSPPLRDLPEHRRYPSPPTQDLPY
jgi:hypothetical protein